jgi:nicotinamidase-related amidase
MKRIHGRDVFDSLAEILKPDHTALLIIDVQNDLFSPGGHFDRFGKNLSRMRAILPNLAVLLNSARRLGLFRIFIQQTGFSGTQSDSPAWLYLRTRKHGISPTFSIDGTWGHEIVAEIKPLEGETAIKKHRSNAFAHTSLDLILRNNGIRSLIVTGAVTEGCVLATAMDALSYDYYPVIAKDCVASRSLELHEISLMLLEDRLDVVSSGEILKTWSMEEEK